MPPFGFSKSKSKSKHRGNSTATGPFASIKMDGGKSKQQRSMITTTLDISLKMEIGTCESRSSNKYESAGRHMHVKDEPISDSEVRNESESDTDSDNEKKKSSKKSSHDKSNSKKSDKSQKSRKSTDKTAMHDMLHDNPANSDDNSNDSSHNFGAGVKSEPYHKTNVKSEMMSGGTNNNDSAHQQKRGDGEGGQATNAAGNLDKSSSSVEEFDNEKPSRVVKVSINLEYDSEVYNDEVNIRRFHKYQRNMEIENTLQVTSFDSSNVISAPVQTPLAAPIGSASAPNIPITDQQFPYESNLPSTMLDCSMQLQLQHQQQMGYSSSDSDSDDSDGNDLDDSDNSSCDECATGPCSTSVLPPLQNGSPASSPAMSMSSYYNKNGKLSNSKSSFS